MRAILAELGVDAEAQARMIEVWNKVDLLDPDDAEALAQVAARTPRVQPISARTGQGVPALLAAVAADSVAEPHASHSGRRRAALLDAMAAELAEPTSDERCTSASTRAASAPGCSTASWSAPSSRPTTATTSTCAGPTATAASTRRCADARNALSARVQFRVCLLIRREFMQD